MKKAPRIKENIALEKAFEKKLKEFSNQCIASFYYWLKPKVKNANEQGWIMKEGKREGVARSLVIRIEELSKQWQEKAEEFANKASEDQTNRILKYVNQRFKKEGFSISMDNFTRQTIKAQIAQQVDLIKSIPLDVKERFESVLFNNLSGLSDEALAQYLKTIRGISDRRAKTIARDQTHKALSNLIKAKAQQYGAEYYIWDTAKDERVSRGYGGHRQLQGRIYRYDKATAIIDSYGSKGHTGQRVNCRCLALSIFLDPTDKIVLRKDAQNGDYYEIVK